MAKTIRAKVDAKTAQSVLANTDATVTYNGLHVQNVSLALLKDTNESEIGFWSERAGFRKDLPMIFIDTGSVWVDVWIPYREDILFEIIA